MVISIWPLVILVAICSTWKKEVWPGSQPVGPGGTITFTGAREPARAGAGTRLLHAHTTDGGHMSHRTLNGVA